MEGYGLIKVLELVRHRITGSQAHTVIHQNRLTLYWYIANEMFFFTLKVVSFSNPFQCRRSGNRLWGLCSFVKQIYTCLISLAENGGGSLVQEYLWKVDYHQSVTNKKHNKFAPKWGRTCGWGSCRFGCARSRWILMPVPWSGRVPLCVLQK